MIRKINKYKSMENTLSLKDIPKNHFSINVTKVNPKKELAPPSPLKAKKFKNRVKHNHIARVKY
jgi:hypothetical protein